MPFQEVVLEVGLGVLGYLLTNPDITD